MTSFNLSSFMMSSFVVHSSRSPRKNMKLVLIAIIQKITIP
jgi:hypothetical protein